MNRIPLFAFVVCTLFIPEVRGDLNQKSENYGAIINLIRTVPSPLVWMILQYNLADELRLTEGQIRKISEIEIRQLPDFYPALLTEYSGTDPTDLSKKDFALFFRKLKVDHSNHQKAVDKQVTEVLSDSQALRLRQLGAQLYLIERNNPALGLRFHDVKLPDAEIAKLKKEIVLSRRKEAASAWLIKFRSKIDLLAKYAGRRSIKKLGPLFSFGFPVDDYPDLRDAFRAGINEPARDNVRRGNQ